MQNTEAQGGHRQANARTSLAFRLRGLQPLESRATSPGGQPSENSKFSRAKFNVHVANAGTDNVVKADPSRIKGKIRWLRSLMCSPDVLEYLDEASSFLNQSNGDPDILGAMRSLQKGARQGKAQYQQLLEMTERLILRDLSSLRRIRFFEEMKLVIVHISRIIKELTTVIEAADKTIKELESNMEEQTGTDELSVD